MKTINYIITIIFILFLFYCKNNRTVDKQKSKVQNISEYANITDTLKVLNINDLQGYWQGETDVNMNIPYRIVHGNNVLDIVCIEGICEINTEEYTHVEAGLIGFTNDTLKDFSNVHNMEKTGRYLVLYNKELKKVRFDENIEYDSNSYTTSLTSYFMLFKKSPSVFVNIDSLPQELQSKMDSVSKVRSAF